MNKDIEEAYADYISTVSARGWAISKECVNHLFSVCVDKKPNAIVDLGSGLSSFVFRYYKKYYNNNLVVFSVDTSDLWLNKSRAFCNKYELDINNFITLSNFYDIKDVVFDIIFIDIELGKNWEIRPRCLDYSIKHFSDKNTIFILDDYHTERMRKLYSEVLKGYSFSDEDVKQMTLDSGGKKIRYSGLIKDVRKNV